MAIPVLSTTLKALSLNAPQLQPNTANSESHQPILLFDLKQLSEEISKALPNGYMMRPLSSDDFQKGYMTCLSQLTSVGDMKESDFADRFNWLKNRSDEYHIIVIEELSTRKIVGSGSILVEKKFIRGCGSVGHIEDIVVDDSQRGKNFGKRYVKVSGKL